MTGIDSKIEKFHSEEIILILLILSSDLSGYDESDLVCFAECIEGRIDLLFDRQYIDQMEVDRGFTPSLIRDLEYISRKTVALYDPQWHLKLRGTYDEMNQLRRMATKALTDLDIEYMEPKSFIDTHLDIDWTQPG